MNVTTDTSLLIDEFVEAIAQGQLKPGEQLKPQRQYAFERGIAPSTASRVYQALHKRGLVVGEVGRGTFVAMRPSPSTHKVVDVPDARIDLEYNFPTAPGQSAVLAQSMAAFGTVAHVESAMKPVSQSGLLRARARAAAALASGPWQPTAEGIVFTGNGRQSIATALSAVVPVGGRLGIEALTYPLVKGIASRLGITLVPIALDHDGPDLEALRKAHRAQPFSALYLQPVLHNPLGHCVSEERREALGEIAEELDFVLIEDRVFGFLADPLGVPANAASRTLVLDSLSKRVAPGVGVGFVHCPRSLRDRVAIAARGGTWSGTPYLLEVGLNLLETGVVRRLEEGKRADSVARQAIARQCLGERLVADARASHGWLVLPDTWRAEVFVAAAARQSIAISPSSSFAVAPGFCPQAVRLALSAPSHGDLRNALMQLRSLADARPADVDLVE